MSDLSVQEAFARDIKVLRDTYPMVCIKTWTPDDFHAVANGPDENGNRGQSDWDAGVHAITAQNLKEILAEDSSRDWLMVRRAQLRSSGGLGVD
jgi:hypothetical protein